LRWSSSLLTQSHSETVTRTSGYETSASKSASFPNARRSNQVRIPSARINKPPAHCEQRLSLLIISAAGLLGHEDWFRQAREKGCRIYIPSGAIPGLDGIKSASIGRIESVLLISRKPVAAVRGSKYVVERNLPLDSSTEDTVIFEGLAEEATRAFPATSNVAGFAVPGD
jgi:predicted dinucleotide-utilizing enzyme